MSLPLADTGLPVQLMKFLLIKIQLLGSIGVISPGFGFVEFIKKFGIERRVYTSGKSKSFLDPFKAEKKEDIERLKINTRTDS